MQKTERKDSRYIQFWKEHMMDTSYCAKWHAWQCPWLANNKRAKVLMLAMTINSWPFPVAKLSLQRPWSPRGQIHVALPSLKITALIFPEIFLIRHFTALVEQFMTSSLYSFASLKRKKILQKGNAILLYFENAFISCELGTLSRVHIKLFYQSDFFTIMSTTEL